MKIILNHLAILFVAIIVFGGACGHAEAKNQITHLPNAKNTVRDTIRFDSMFCAGSTVELCDSIAATRHWGNGDTSTCVSVVVQGDTLVYYTYNDAQGDPCVRNFALKVAPLYNDTISDFLCHGKTYTRHGFFTDTIGFHHRQLQSIHGCDSTVWLYLDWAQSYRDTLFETICSNERYERGGFNEKDSGIYQQVLQSQYGCDSVVVLHLTVNPAYSDTIHAEIYVGDTYTGYGFTVSEKGFHTQEYKTVLGCDSLLVLDLKVQQVLFPNLVTPNGDGVNDIYVIKNLVEENIFPENEFHVFSRYGRKIYSAKNIRSQTDFWDPNQTNTPDGTYFYTFTGKGKLKNIFLQGVIEVAR